jgi:glycosyltransferase involved in cell wall biosynthesis
VKVSVVLCCFNGRAHIAEQIDSVLAQTRLPDEIVLADDGSTELLRLPSSEFRMHRQRGDPA